MKFLSNIKVALVALSVMAISTGCEDFLDQEPTASVPVASTVDNTGGLRSILNGTYRLMRVSDSEHDNTGLVSYNLVMDVMGQDLIISQNWYAWDNECDFGEANWRRTSTIWERHYKIINNANIVLANVDAAEGTDDDKKIIKGEAAAIRALAYFNLVRAYQHTYLVNPNAPAVPIYTVPAKKEDTGNPRATVQAVYDRINADLKTALDNLVADRPLSIMNKGNINLNVAQGIKARVLLEMGDYANAAAFAEKAATGYPLMSAEQYNTSGFNDMNNAEWIWAMPYAKDQNLGYASFFSFVDHKRAAGYKNVYVNDDFVTLFADNDMRNTFVNNPKGADYEQFYMRKFADKPDNSGDVVLMRAAEMMLIQAESYARTGSEELAKDIIENLRKQRFSSTAASLRPVTSGQALIDEILLERRKELYGEGFALLDIKRCQLPLERTGNHKYAGSLSANHPRFIFHIPQREIDANDNMTTADQNPSFGAYPW